MVKSAFLLCLIIVCSLFAGCAQNPVTGDRQLMLLSYDQEQQLGDEYAPEVEKQLGGPIADARIQAYVDSVGQKVARASLTPDRQFRYIAVNSDAVNAVALPGGHIFITRGMLEAMQTEAQLAAVLAHETVHVAARHSANAMSRQIGIDILLSAISNRTSETTGAVAQLAADLVSLKYSRDDEYEADAYGADYLAKAGYDPQGMVQLMEILQAQDSARPIEFFSTHPNPGNRLEKIRGRIAAAGYKADTATTGRTEYKSAVLDRL
ncbi:MAG TPA: M48 family metallopeptidase [Anaerohalosphaeraceae bacterium]|jgi:predicted Zn-dependent protease|nr:M48 family metallopeptidase [Anaerohalosphaeraceae bacterium]HRT50665.1 M48 family metallopeptidase [Anaerohalosphaeraceae bacterium]HRT86647.1 M48 family metallopeptidase [Anaerohalosphaeraceae bacterium]